MDRIICHANGTCDMVFSNPMWDIFPIIIIFAMITLAAIVYWQLNKKGKK